MAAAGSVLITAASRRVPLVRAFRRALAATGSGAVIVTDVNPLSAAVYAADRAFRVPLATDPGYPDAILALCQQTGADLVVPTIDDELTALATAAPAFAAAGIRVVVSPPETTRTCDDKYETCRRLRERGIAAAASFLPAEGPQPPRFPLFLKPRRGRGSVGAHAVANARQLAFYLEEVRDPILQEYLDGPEFTIDVLCDFEGRPLAVVPRERVVVRAGVSDCGRTVRDRALIDLALACVAAMPFAGALNIQCRVVDGRPVVFEINPRFSGGIPLTIEAGADFPRMLVDLAAGRPVPPRIGQFRENVWMTNFEDSVFLAPSQIRLEQAGSVQETV